MWPISRELERALAEARAFCTGAGVDIDAILAADKLARLALISKGVEALISPDDHRREFFRRAGAATRATRPSCLTDGRPHS